jgi:hypothetical protein
VIWADRYPASRTKGDVRGLWQRAVPCPGSSAGTAPYTRAAPCGLGRLHPRDSGGGLGSCASTRLDARPTRLKPLWSKAGTARRDSRRAERQTECQSPRTSLDACGRAGIRIPYRTTLFAGSIGHDPCLGARSRQGSLHVSSRLDSPVSPPRHQHSERRPIRCVDPGHVDRPECCG